VLIGLARQEGHKIVIRGASAIGFAPASALYGTQVRGLFGCDREPWV
jgi:hypothetical protein